MATTIWAPDFTGTFSTDWDTTDSGTGYVAKPSIWNNSLHVYSDHGVIKQLGSTYNHIRIAFFLHQPGIFGTTHNANLIAVGNGATETFRIDIDEDVGVLTIYPGLTSVTVENGTNIPLPTDIWMHVGIEIDTDNGFITTWINGVMAQRCTGTVVTAGITYVEVNKHIGSVDFWSTDVYLNQFFIDNASGESETAPGTATQTNWVETRNNGTYELVSSDFETGDTSDFTDVGTGASVVSGGPGSSVYALESSGKIQGSVGWRSVGKIWTDTTVEFAFYRGDVDGAAATPWHGGMCLLTCGYTDPDDTLSSSFVNPVVELRYNDTDSTVDLLVANSIVATVVDTYLPYHTWTSVKLEITLSDSGSIAVSFDGTERISYSGSLTGNGAFVSEVLFAEYVSAFDGWHTITDQTYWDDIVVSDVVTDGVSAIVGPAKAAGNITITLDSVDITDYIDQSHLNGLVSTFDKTVFSSGAMEYIPTIGNWAFPVGGFWTPSADTMLFPLANRQSTVSVSLTFVSVTYSWSMGFIADYRIAVGSPREALMWLGSVAPVGAPTRTVQ